MRERKRERRERERGREERERARPRGRQRRAGVEAKCAGSQASGSTYRMSVVNVRSTEGLTRGRQTQIRTTRNRELPGKFPARR